MRAVVHTNLLLLCPPEHRHVQGVWPPAKTKQVNEAISQLVFADVVLLNKEDPVPRDVRWPKFIGTGTERNAFPFKKDLSLSSFFSFFLFPRTGLSTLSNLSLD